MLEITVERLRMSDENESWKLNNEGLREVSGRNSGFIFWEIVDTGDMIRNLGSFGEKHADEDDIKFIG